MKIEYRGRTLLCRGWPLQRRTGQKSLQRRTGQKRHSKRVDKKGTEKDRTKRYSKRVYREGQDKKYRTKNLRGHHRGRPRDKESTYKSFAIRGQGVIHKYPQVSTRVPIRVYKKKNKKNNTYLDCKVCVINALCRD